MQDYPKTPRELVPTDAIFKNGLWYRFVELVETELHEYKRAKFASLTSSKVIDVEFLYDTMTVVTSPYEIIEIMKLYTRVATFKVPTRKNGLASLSRWEEMLDDPVSRYVTFPCINEQTHKVHDSKIDLREIVAVVPDRFVLFS